MTIYLVVRTTTANAVYSFTGGFAVCYKHGVINIMIGRQSRILKNKILFLNIF